MSILKDALGELPDYRVPQSGFQVKLNQNENPVDWPESLKTRVLEKLAESSWNRYPDGGEGGLLAALSDYTGFPSSWILAGNGSNELIQSVAQACRPSGGGMVTVTPGFSVYTRVARVLGLPTVEVPLGENLDVDMPAMLAAARGADLVFLTSPNNPTGIEIETEDVERIAGACPGIVALDEAYFEFSGRTGAPLLEKLKNLVILRTFSKAWSSAGLRLGYLLGPPELVSPISRARLPFSVGLLQQIAGTALLENRAELQGAVETVIKERERLSGILKGWPGMRVYPSGANFLLFECMEFSASLIADRLGKAGVAVRRFEFPRLRKALRVTIGTREENQEFLKALAAAFEEGSE